MPTTRELWTAGTWSTGPPPGPGPLVVDSWLVEDGAVRGLEHHFDRFHAAATGIAGVAAAVVVDFLASVPSRLPTTGSWFPRVEAWPDGRLALWVRPAPPRAATTRLWVPPGPDPRRVPGAKGPDLTALAALRERAVRAGADDAVLWAPDGAVLEAAHAALLWWRDGALCRPPSTTLPSVTVALLEEVARQSRVPLRRERCAVDELADRPVWTANALHGLRHAEGPSLPNYGGQSFAWWRAELEATARPLHSSVDGAGATGDVR
ncbi:aminotransferase class IV [Actinophytocola sp.]|uniref:aminotransferase class IV n=1 Tax=Actinophytocola sp. TaxID=1872138 RepID=UPI003D6AA321